MEHISLFDLNKIVKSKLEEHLNSSYWVVAEIGELRLNQKGHCYLELVEKQQETVIAKMRATIWSYTYRNLSVWFQGITGQPLQSGMKILCNLSVQFHELYGLSANIKDIDANYTLGEKARKRQEIINRLVGDGIFDMNKSTDLPTVPQNIAIISSATAAGYGDFMHQLERNQYGYKFRTKLFNALMQGEQAKSSIINALHQVNDAIENYDILVIIRGGGSQTDLDCFDSYDLAFHVTQFPIPVITGIGHERDETITDLVAHAKMKTPTAVSEFLISGARIFEESIEECFSKVYTYAEQYLSRHQQLLENLELRLKAGGKNRVLQNNNAINMLTERLKNASANYIVNQYNRLEIIEKSVDLLNPKHTIARGYSLTSFNNKVLKGNETLKPGDKIKTETQKQTIYSTIDKLTQK